MSVQYEPIRQWELEVIGLLAGFKPPVWKGPALPRPEGKAGIEEIIDTVNKLIARGQYLIQAKDGLSVEYTLNNITATAERFLFGTEEQVQQAADLRSVLLAIEAFLTKILASPADARRITSALTVSRGRAERQPTSAVAARGGAASTTHSVASATTVTAAPAASNGDADYSAFTLEDPSQFSISWSTFEDAFRKGFPHVAEYSAAITDAGEATRQFWLRLRSTALPFNLLVLQKLTAPAAATFRKNFGTTWVPRYDQLVGEGRLYGIDMTIFTGFDPQQETNGTLRFTPATMVLLEMNDRKELNPIGVYVADPKGNASQTYLPSSPAWIYALLAAKTSLTVYGIWLGHVYTQHLVTAAMQMATLNTLPADNIIFQLLAPQSHYTIAFDLLLLLGWSSLSPPTSIGDAGKFLTLCNKFSETHDFFSTDPANTLARLNLDPSDFTDPSIDDQPWNLYPNVRTILQIWQMTSDYVSAVVDAGYETDAAVAADSNLANWISAASGDGHVAGLPRMDSKAALKAVVASVLYRITFHGIGRLRSISSPEPAFASNYPPCLQSATIPDPQTTLPTSELLKAYLPNVGTLAQLTTFYEIFSYNAPYVPLVPHKGPEDELFYDQAKHPGANKALIDFRNGIQNMIRTLQPDWIQIGQWPRNIEL